jgi:hypothetical protein
MATRYEYTCALAIVAEDRAEADEIAGEVTLLVNEPVTLGLLIELGEIAPPRLSLEDSEPTEEPRY